VTLVIDGSNTSVDVYFSMPQTQQAARRPALRLLLLLLLLKSVEFDDDVALLLSVAGLVMGPHVTSESEIGGTDSAALRTSWTSGVLVGIRGYTPYTNLRVFLTAYTHLSDHK